MLAPGAIVAAILVFGLGSGCGGDGGEAGTGEAGGLSGRIEADGSSTVAPFTSVAAEGFQRENEGVQVTVGVSGTGGGFERFCAGETDLSDASRPIEGDEAASCRKKGIEYVELHVANDALTVVVNGENDWATCLSVAQLKRLWQPGSKVRNWDQLDPKFPDEKLTLYGAGTDSGTFDYFTEAIVGEEGASRSDYSASENDNVIVQGVSGERGALGYFGFSYFEENQDRLNAVAIRAGGACVQPSVKAAQNGTYKPLSRPLFIYAKAESLKRPEVAAFVRYLIDNQRRISEQARFVPLTAAQVAETRSRLAQATNAGGS